jgi:hypothetical protein
MVLGQLGQRKIQENIFLSGKKLGTIECVSYISNWIKPKIEPWQANLDKGETLSPK